MIKKTQPSGPGLPALPDPAEVCPTCTKCCRHVALEIDPPVSIRRVSTTLWYLYHRGISIYVGNDGCWYLLVPADCANLKPDGLCAVYEARPYICREYEIDGCEGTSVEPAEKHRFDDAASFAAWLARNRSALWERCRGAGIIPAELEAGPTPPASGEPGGARRRPRNAPAGSGKAPSSGPRSRPR